MGLAALSHGAYEVNYYKVVTCTHTCSRMGNRAYFTSQLTQVLHVLLQHVLLNARLNPLTCASLAANLTWLFAAHMTADQGQERTP